MRARPSFFVALVAVAATLTPIGPAGAADPKPGSGGGGAVIPQAVPLSSTPEPHPPAFVPMPFFPGHYIDPIDGPVISGFGRRGGRRHEGVDIKGPNRGPVVATMTGVIVQSGRGLSGYGTTVTIDHGWGLTTLYAHLSATELPAGTPVAQGQVIGYEGQTGRASTPHVHYEVRFLGTPGDPMPFLSR